ncbi:hypothetical protein [Pseudozobellia thermophila]|uniref:Uncharacterized protein n=1 Tax=Pseudozobellia thermophila TaxID=192903 RepID=A0A1M6EGW6_9FLAO|nr:hypothetical protein [Pseudozobellia thermophila]SHI84757.1 hypothetical protein SAMN04488513_10257 [Pseudozobellia thermophila]
MNKAKEIFYLKLYSITLTAILLALVLTSFTQKNTTGKFDEITVERINVVEPNGDLKMVISNQNRQHAGMFDGKVLFEGRKRPAGIVFFNEEQDEVGGLMYQGNKEGGSSWILSVDQYKTDQVMQMRYLRNTDGESRYGIQFWDKDEDYTMPVIAQKIDSLTKEGKGMGEAIEIIKNAKEGNPITAERMFIGKTSDKQAGLFIQDQKGTDRLRIYVDSTDQPRIEVLDNKGEVVKNLVAH